MDFYIGFLLWVFTLDFSQAGWAGWLAGLAGWVAGLFSGIRNVFRNHECFLESGMFSGMISASGRAGPRRRGGEGKRKEDDEGEDSTQEKAGVGTDLGVGEDSTQGKAGVEEDLEIGEGSTWGNAELGRI